MNTSTKTVSMDLVIANPELFKKHFVSGTSAEDMAEMYYCMDTDKVRQLFSWAKVQGYLTDTDFKERRGVIRKSVVKQQGTFVNLHEKMKEQLGHEYDLYCLIYTKSDLARLFDIPIYQISKAFPDYDKIKRSSKYAEERVFLYVRSITNIDMYSSTALGFCDCMEFPFSPDRRKGVRHAITLLSDREISIVKDAFYKWKSMKELREIYGLSDSRINQLISRIGRKLNHPTRNLWMLRGFKEQEEILRASREKTATASVEVVEDLDISPRTYNGLKRAGINTVSELKLAILTGHIYNIYSFGKKSVEELERVMQNIDSTVECPFDSLSQFKKSSVYKEWVDYMDRNHLASFSHCLKMDALKEMIEEDLK